TGVSAGTAVVTYDVGGGCYATYTITNSMIGGPTYRDHITACYPGTLTLVDAYSGGTWAMTGMGSIGLLTGVVTAGAVSSPTPASIHYTMSSGDCASLIAVTSITVAPTPSAGITALVSPSVCVGNPFGFEAVITTTLTLVATPPFVWHYTWSN